MLPHSKAAAVLLLLELYTVVEHANAMNASTIACRLTARLVVLVLGIWPVA